MLPDKKKFKSTWVNCILSLSLAYVGMGTVASATWWFMYAENGPSLSWGHLVSSVIFFCAFYYFYCICVHGCYVKFENPSTTAKSISFYFYTALKLISALSNMSRLSGLKAQGFPATQISFFLSL